MAEKTENDDKQLSRRARRQAEQALAEKSDEAEEREESSESEDAEAAGGADEEASESEESEGSADDETAKVASRKSADRPKKPSKSQKKRAKQEERSATATVRDRNKRLREQAAERRKGKRERERAVARGLDASEMVDDALARSTHAATTFVREHFNVIQWVIVLVVASGIGWQIYSWRSNKTTAKASDQLMDGVNADLAKVGPEPANTEEAQMNPRPNFATDDERLSAAEKAFKAAENDSSGQSGSAILAKLGEAGTQYDEGKFDEARAKYESVRDSALAQHDADVRLRALEGVGLCLEAKGDLDGALKIFEQLEKSGETGFGPLALYHQARVLYAKGDKTKAKELLTKLDTDLAKEPTAITGQSYLAHASHELLAMIDPSVAPSSPQSYSPEQLDALKAQIMKDPTKLKKMLEDMGKMKAPSMPDPMEEPPPLPNEPAPGNEPAPSPSETP